MDGLHCKGGEMNAVLDIIKNLLLFVWFFVVCAVVMFVSGYVAILLLTGLQKLFE